MFVVITSGETTSGAIGPFDSKDSAEKYLRGIGAEEVTDPRLGNLWHGVNLNDDYEIVLLEPPARG